MKILIIEDERRLSEAISYILRENKYQVESVYNGNDGYHHILSNNYDLVILDINLPYMNGYEVLKKVRQEGNKTLVLMLTARSEIEDKVKGLDLGADDYLAKPFDTKELLARIKALGRRYGNYETETIEFGDIVYCSDILTLKKGKKSVVLTHLEGELMNLLLKRKNLITPKETIIVRLWGYDSDADDNNVEVYIFFLRKKLKFLESRVTIKTTRNVGYSLEVIGNV
jgi:DNA-binding response OmpR family regulator